MSWRPTFALVLLLLYYGGAVAVVAGLLFFPVAMFTISTEPPNLVVAVFCLGMAGFVAWNVFPRRLRIDPPGPRLTPESQPRLFSLLGEVAREVGQPVCDEVALVLGPNLGVAQQRSRLGFGKRRVMTLGMPLLQVLSRRQLRTALLHEHGHFSRGRSFADPWIYQCRLAMIRAVESSKQTIFPFHILFPLYTKLFLRITQAMARQHEVAADEIALQKMGSQSWIEALGAVTGTDLAFQMYMNAIVTEVLAEGLIPPIAEGFDPFRKAPQVAVGIRQQVARIELDAKTGAYDTHPSLHERIEHARKLNAPEACAREDDGEASWDLLDQHDQLEEQVTARAIQPAKNMERVSWSEVGDRAFLPAWERALQSYRESLQNVKPSDVAAWIEDPVALVERFSHPDPGPVPFEARLDFAIRLIGAALAVALRRQGYTIGGPPSESLYLERDGQRCDPYEITAQFFSGEMTPSQWLSVWQNHGLADLDLGQLAPTVTPRPAWESERAPEPDEVTLQPKTERPWWLAIAIVWFIALMLAALGDR